MPFALIEEADWDQMMDVKREGMFLVTKGVCARHDPAEERRHRQTWARSPGARAGGPGALRHRQERRGRFTLSLARELSR